jgi:hypothetical protein
MTPITHTTPGVITDLGEDFAGRYVVIRPGSLPRFQCRKLQIAKATGGAGCKANALGSGVFLTPMWVEFPEGSGRLLLNPGREHDYKGRRGSVIGLATPELIAEVSEDPSTIEPGDPHDLCVMAVYQGEYGKADTVAAALKMIGKRSIGAAGICVVHRETWVDDFGFISTPGVYVVEGRPACQWVSGNDGVTRTLEAAEKMAAALIAASRASTPA